MATGCARPDDESMNSWDKIFEVTLSRGVDLPRREVGIGRADLGLVNYTFTGIIELTKIESWVVVDVHYQVD